MIGLKNNNNLKKIALKTDNLQYLANKSTLTHDEYMKLCYTDAYQKEFNRNLNQLKKSDKKNWY